ncbi:MAG: argininosuccinate lyase, partial [Alphaproteobacteria bacterium]
MKNPNRCAVALLLSTVLASAALAQTTKETSQNRRDEFAWLTDFNKASAVMVVEQGIVSRDLGTTIARSVRKVSEDANQPGAPRPGITGYLTVEASLAAVGGPDVSRLHSGRSRQDLLATYNRGVLRDRLLDMLAAQGEVRSRLQRLAGEHVDTVIPAYTNGVQAQPITLGHYLLAFDAALARDGERLRQAFPRVNRNPLGSAALGTSSFPVDRNRLAQLLGFDAPEVNSYDANLVSAMDVPLEVVHIAQGSALTTGALIEDVVTQYRSTEPWLLLREGNLTGPSSIMPQKRNPYGLNEVRQAASKVVADAIGFAVLAHNVAPGMLDYKGGTAETTLDDARDMLGKLSKVLDALVVNVPAALAQ